MKQDRTTTETIITIKETPTVLNIVSKEVLQELDFRGLRLPVSPRPADTAQENKFARVKIDLYGNNKESSWNIMPNDEDYHILVSDIIAQYEAQGGKNKDTIFWSTFKSRMRISQVEAYYLPRSSCEETM